MMKTADGTNVSVCELIEQNLSAMETRGAAKAVSKGKASGKMRRQVDKVSAEEGL